MECDSFESAVSLAGTLLQDAPSARVETQYLLSTCPEKKTSVHSLLDIDSKVFFEEVMENFKKAFLVHLGVMIREAPTESLVTTACWHIIIDVEIVSSKEASHVVDANSPHRRAYCLSKFPRTLLVFEQNLKLCGVLANRPLHFVA